jgi:pyridoxine 5-phosphate synthase
MTIPGLPMQKAFSFAAPQINLQPNQEAAMKDSAPHRLRLGVNIDHVATVRNARGAAYPSPVRAALSAEAAGADGITAHLREDRRHILDADITALMAALTRPLNFEMAATAEMQDIALAHRPHAVCIVPERREERTTEGGLDVAGDEERLARFIAPLVQAGCRVSMFIGHDPNQILACARIGAAVVELHTGQYCDLHAEGKFAERDKELVALQAAAQLADELGLEVHAGHGLTYETVGPIAQIKQLRELNIGHFLIGEAIFVGLGPAIAEMRRVMDAARAEAA